MVFLKAAFPRQAKKWSTRYNDYGKNIATITVTLPRGESSWTHTLTIGLLVASWRQLLSKISRPLPVAEMTVVVLQSRTSRAHQNLTGFRLIL